MVQLSHPYMTTGKTIALTTRAFVDKKMSLPFNMLSSFVIAFLLRSKRLLILCLQSLSTVILEPKKSLPLFPFPTPSIYLPWSDAMIIIFWILNFKWNFPPSSFTSRLFSSSLLSANRVVSFAYLRLLIFLLAILIPVWTSSSLAFCMMYSA